MKIWTYITIIALVILGVSCSSCKSSKDSSETSSEKEILDPYAALSKSKKLPRGAVLVKLKYSQDELNYESKSFNAEVIEILRRGQQAPIISIDEKLNIEFDDEQRELIKNIDNDSEVLIKVLPGGKNTESKNIWQIISIN